MIANLPPAALDALDQVGQAIKHEAKPEIQAPATQQTPGVLARIGSAVSRPFVALLRVTAMSALTVALFLTVSMFLGLLGYITGSEQQRAAAVIEKDTIVDKFAKELPLKVEFQQGAVESYGFVRNWLWRQASNKKFAMSATISTDRDANTAMKNTAIIQTVGDEQYKLKPGTSDVWQLVPTTVEAEVKSKIAPAMAATAVK